MKRLENTTTPGAGCPNRKTPSSQSRGRYQRPEKIPEARKIEHLKDVLNLEIRHKFRITDPNPETVDPLLQGPSADVNISAAVDKIKEWVGPETFAHVEPVPIVDSRV